ncbi:hypothetical protein ACWNS2_10135 [Planococcus plakortidis]
MEEQSFTQEEAVLKYGNVAIRKHFFDKKAKSKKIKGTWEQTKLSSL